MSRRALVLFDDDVADGWRPFTLTRPAAELRYGALLLRERAERICGCRCVGYIAASHLLHFDEPGAPRPIEPEALPRDVELVLLSSRAVPEWDAGPPPAGAARLLLMEGEPCGAVVPPGAPLPEPAFFRDAARTPAGGEPFVWPGRLLRQVWDLVTGTPDQTARDVPALARDASEHALPEGVHRLGDGALALGRGVRIDPGVVLDTRGGPIVLGDDVVVHPFTHIVGPSAIDAGTILLGGAFEAVSIGPACRVHGQVEESVILGYANKAHDGFLGHAYLGRWVNLGALTTNSDLKNNYGTVRIRTATGEHDTGLTKLGCLLGDHVKTAIGTLLSTGTVVEAGCNLFGAATPPRYVPPFTWGAGADAAAYDIDRFLATARIVEARRGLTLSDEAEALLREAWWLGRQTAGVARGEEEPTGDAGA